MLRGDMSLVGPRPERPYFAELFAAEIPGYGDRHRVPVGITGWAQVHGLNGDTSIEERVRFDNRYIESWSLWRDLVILARTSAAVVTGLRLDEGEPVGGEPPSEPAPDVIDLRLVEVDIRAIESDGAADAPAEPVDAITPPEPEDGAQTNGQRKNGSVNGRSRRSPDGPARQP